MVPGYTHVRIRFVHYLWKLWAAKPKNLDVVTTVLPFACQFCKRKR
jgi:hypothetical protein